MKVNSHFHVKICAIKEREVVKRIFTWLENFRRLSRIYEKLPQSTRNMLMIKHIPSINCFNILIYNTCTRPVFYQISIEGINSFNSLKVFN